MTQKSQLVGYVRKRNGSITVSIDAEAFEMARKNQTKDGREFVTLVANADKVGQILEGEREVTSLCLMVADGE